MRSLFFLILVVQFLSIAAFAEESSIKVAVLRATKENTFVAFNWKNTPAKEEVNGICLGLLDDLKAGNFEIIRPAKVADTYKGLVSALTEFQSCKPRFRYKHKDPGNFNGVQALGLNLPPDQGGYHEYFNYEGTKNFKAWILPPVSDNNKFIIFSSDHLMITESKSSLDELQTGNPYGDPDAPLYTIFDTSTCKYLSLGSNAMNLWYGEGYHGLRFDRYGIGHDTDGLVEYKRTPMFLGITREKINSSKEELVISTMLLKTEKYHGQLIEGEKYIPLTNFCEFRADLPPTQSQQ